jgi:hypothetical protein
VSAGALVGEAERAHCSDPEPWLEDEDRVAVELAVVDGPERMDAVVVGPVEGEVGEGLNEDRRRHEVVGLRSLPEGLRDRRCDPQKRRAPNRAQDERVGVAAVVGEVAELAHAEHGAA